MRYNRDDYSACDWKASPSDYARQKKAIAERDKRIARQKRKERLAMIATCAMVVGIGVALFYVGSN